MMNRTERETEKLIEELIVQFHMIEHGDVVIAGVSGGADSVCLLLVLCALREKFGFDVKVCHVNHCLRGAQADADEEYVKKLCGELGVECRVFRKEVELIAEKRKQSCEEAGREVRREAFEQMCAEDGGTKIATAHHRDDQAETVLLNIARGTGIRGLCGIVPVRENRIRPLLSLTRDMIEAYLREKGIAWRTDATNEEDDYTRNRIRHKVLPVLENEVNDQTVKHLESLSRQAEEVCEYLDYGVEQLWKTCVSAEKKEQKGGISALNIEKEPFFQGFPAVRKLLLQKCIAKVRGGQKDLTSAHLQAVSELFERQVGKSVDLPGGVAAKRTYYGVKIVKQTQSAKKTEKTARKSDADRRLSLRFVENGDISQAEEIPQKSYTKWVDYDIIKCGLCVRTRQSGDYLVIDDQGRRQKLKAWFINEKIPKEERDRMLLVADGSHIVWIPGYRMSRAYKVTEKTKKIVEIKITEEKKMAETIREMISEEKVDERIRELGQKISEDYAGKQVHLICVLKGGVFFMCELAKRITVPVSMDFMCVGSYGDGTASSGVVRIAKDLDESIENKEVLIVEDIIDSGNTLYYLIDVLKKRNPASMRLCTLLDKPDRRVKDVKVDYCGFEIPDEFVVGYGLDYAQKYRNLPYIGVVEGVE